jgi:hypothetical protein
MEERYVVAQNEINICAIKFFNTWAIKKVSKDNMMMARGL